MEVSTTCYTSFGNVAPLKKTVNSYLDWYIVRPNSQFKKLLMSIRLLADTPSLMDYNQFVHGFEELKNLVNYEEKVNITFL